MVVIKVDMGGGDKNDKLMLPMHVCVLHIHVPISGPPDMATDVLPNPIMFSCMFWGEMYSKVRDIQLVAICNVNTRCH